MAKTHKSSTKFSSSFIPDDGYAVEAIGESEYSFSQKHHRSDDSYARKKRCLSLNTSKTDGFFAPVQVISLSKISGSERKNLEMRFRRELEQVQMFQKKLIAKTTSKENGIAVPSSSVLPLIKKPNQNIPHSKCGNGRCEPTKQGTSLPLITVMMKQCEALLKRLMTHQYAWIFNTPVDVVKLKIPDYFTVIKQPMDLGTIKSKLLACSYSNPWDFASDVRLTFFNAMTYNPPTNGVHVMATVMSKFFEMRWKPIEKKLAITDTDMIINREEKVIKAASSESLKKKTLHLDPALSELDKEPKMTDEEKLNLSRRLSLISELPQHIIYFLRRHTNKAGQYSEDEIEVDFDSLSVDVLLQLKKLLDDHAKGRNMEQLQKTELCEMEILIESGLSNSSMHPCKDHSDLLAFNGPADEDEDLDICGDPPITSYSSVDRGKTAMRGTSCGRNSNSSSSKSESSTESSSSSGNESNVKVPGSLNPTKENERLHGAMRHGKGSVNEVHKAEQNAHRKAISAATASGQDGENAPSERQVSPDKLYRAAILKSRFADTILKAREKTLDQGEKRDPEKQRQQRKELERQQREERDRLQAEAKAAEESRLRAEAKAAAEARRKLELEREASRQALLQMEKTVEINENSLLMKDLEMLRAAGESMPGSAIYISSDCSNEGIDGFKLGGGINPLEQLGLFIKADDDEDAEDDEARSSAPRNDVEEGEID